jgi:hypothetical protein
VSIRLALHDAANNCAREGARARLTLKSGVQFTGSLKPLASPGADTAMVYLPCGEWATVDVEEVAAVESKR